MRAGGDRPGRARERRTVRGPASPRRAHAAGSERLIRRGWEPTSPMAPYASSTPARPRGRVALLWLAVRRSVRRRVAAVLGL